MISGVSLSTTTGTDAMAGTYVISIGGGSAANYEISYVDGTLTQAKAHASGSAINPYVWH